MKRVAVEPNLTQVVNALKDAGYEVVEMEPGRSQRVDSIVVAGMSKDLMGISDTETRVPVINAEGLTAEEVLEQVRRRMPT